MVELDDFNVRQIGRDFRRQLHHQNGTDGKVRCNEDTGLLFQSQGMELMALFGRKSRRTDDHVDAVSYAGFSIFKNDGRRRKIDDDVRLNIVKGLGKIAFDGKA